MKASVAKQSFWDLRLALRLGLFALTAAAALYFGFLHFTVPDALILVRNAGYYVILLTFSLWILAMWRQRTRSDAEVFPRPALHEHLLAGAVIGVLTLLALAHETFRSKILFDEYVLQSTAYNLHFFRDNSAMVRGYDIQGVFLSTDSYVDKRPVFFAFLLSLVHDLTGYRPLNVYVLNAGLFVGALGLVWRLGWRLNGRRGGLVAIGLIGSLPLFVQNASGAGMELLNIYMLLVTILHAANWLERPDECGLSVFVLSLILLVQTRYESALYVLPAGAAILLGWSRVRRVVMPWAVIVAPLLLIPVALQQKVISNSPMMWELRENQTSRFSVDYLEGNLSGAWRFFSSFGVTHANSLLLGPLGFVALSYIAWRLARKRRELNVLAPIHESLLLFGVVIAGATVLIMFYYWASFDDPMAARFALPLHLLMTFAVVVVAAVHDRRWPASWTVVSAAAFFVFASSAPKQSYHLYSHIGNDEIEWEQRIVANRPSANRLIITNKSPLSWLINQTSSILLVRSRGVADRLADQLVQPDFAEILVMQGARPTSNEGRYEIAPEDVLPEWFHLELVAERRFGTKLARISRLVSIDLPEDFQSSTPPPVTSEAARPLNPSEK